MSLEWKSPAHAKSACGAGDQARVHAHRGLQSRCLQDTRGMPLCVRAASEIDDSSVGSSCNRYLALRYFVGFARWRCSRHASGGRKTASLNLWTSEYHEEWVVLASGLTSATGRGNERVRDGEWWSIATKEVFTGMKSRRSLSERLAESTTRQEGNSVREMRDFCIRHRSRNAKIQKKENCHDRFS